MKEEKIVAWMFFGFMLVFLFFVIGTIAEKAIEAYAQKPVACQCVGGEE